MVLSKCTLAGQSAFLEPQFSSPFYGGFSTRIRRNHSLTIWMQEMGHRSPCYLSDTRYFGSRQSDVRKWPTDGSFKITKRSGRLRGVTMKPLNVTGAGKLKDALREELHHSVHARYINRLCSLLFVADGHTCYEVARCLGGSPRSLELWIHSYEKEGIDGLRNHSRTSQGSRTLTPSKLGALERDLQKEPAEFGYEQPRWTARLVMIHLEQRYGLSLSLRQCGRIRNQLKGPRSDTHAKERLAK